MIVVPSQRYPESWIIRNRISLSNPESRFAEFSDEGNIKIQIWLTDIKSGIVSSEEVELLYIYTDDTLWLPLFFNGRLCLQSTYKTQSI